MPTSSRSQRPWQICSPHASRSRLKVCCLISVWARDVLCSWRGPSSPRTCPRPLALASRSCAPCVRACRTSHRGYFLPGSASASNFPARNSTPRRRGSPAAHGPRQRCPGLSALGRGAFQAISHSGPACRGCHFLGRYFCSVTHRGSCSWVSCPPYSAPASEPMQIRAGVLRRASRSARLARTRARSDFPAGPAGRGTRSMGSWRRVSSASGLFPRRSTRWSY
mmetsp:Transcript_37207/g.117110  ORF Transcript_37207/g.117110 Transcript_37207/m.117110 type:complete len:223 (-) Transcript_37207:538-1206(-)